MFIFYHKAMGLRNTVKLLISQVWTKSMGQRFRQPLTCASFGKQQQQRESLDRMGLVGLRLACSADKEHLDLLVRLALILFHDKPLLRS
jgi:hypothetical protein